MRCAGDELVASVEDAECPEVVRSEESAAVGLRNLVTQWHIIQKGMVKAALMTCMSCIIFSTSSAMHGIPDYVCLYKDFLCKVLTSACTCAHLQ